ncbi:MAG TPA: AAA family ATPase [Devosiaceae bacterium]|jgi:adenylate kinase family enzyme
MHNLIALDALGPRICICGPSNAGKSTLAAAIARKQGLPAVHLDQLYHFPDTNWQPRPPEEFARLHAEAIAEDRWAMEGNYFALVPSRLTRATGIILLGSEPWRGLLRYVRRTLFEKERHGHIKGGQDHLNWMMIKIILVQQPRKRQRDLGILSASGLPMVQLNSLRELNDCYRTWQLQR